MDQTTAPLPPESYFHDDSGSVRFWVRGGANFIGASIRKESLHFRYKATLSGAGALDSYRAHQTEIDAAVVRRIASGSIEPVMLRESDLAAPEVR